MEYCKKANRIIVVVEEAKERLESLGIERGKISVVSNTLNIPRFILPEAKPDPDYFTLLYAGGINKHRGLQYVIRGLKYLANLPRPVRLWILGSGSYMPSLKKLAQENGVSDRVSFMGWKDFKEMQDFFGEADVCLIPHVKSEHTDTTIPHKIFQYMYAGKPFVASDCDPIMRIAQETRSGLIYDWNNPEAWADCIRQLAENPDLVLQLARNGKRQVAEKHNWKKDAETLISIYA
jgi:glycosyltransferase involved in cell wall biosynthesis